MGTSRNNNDDVEFQKGDEGVLDRLSSGMSTNSFFASAWDPVVSLNQHESLGGSSMVFQSEFNHSPYPVALENQGISSTTPLPHYPSDSSFQMAPKFPCFGSGSFSEMVGSLGLGECGQIVNTGCPTSYTSNTEGNNERTIATGVQSLLQPATGASPYGKRRKRGAESNSPLDKDKMTEGELKKASFGEISDVPKEQEKKPKTEQNPGANLRGKQAVKQAKENILGGEASKENYIHVRARRGQATNSHSLAERVRREKISERMRMLQELVPGCNKITGKAVMLDEIINYVQSLQQQVEFLSMKLATVNPELSIDIETVLSKELLRSRGGTPAVLEFNPGINLHPYSQEVFQAGMSVIPSTNPQVPQAPHDVLENELQNPFQIGIHSNSAMQSLGPNGRQKPDL